MKLIIDAREAYGPKKAGKGQWAHGFIQELTSRNVDLVQITEASQNIDNTIQFPGGVIWHFSVARYVKDTQPDAYISPTSFIVPWLLRKAVHVVPIVHDLIAFRSEPHNAKAKMIERLLLPRCIRSAAHICTVSSTTSQDLMQRYNCDPSSITPIFAGPMSETASLSAPDGKTILCIGTLCPRKNQLRLIKAFSSLPEPFRSQYRLVLVGAHGWNDTEIVRQSASVKGVEWKDYVSDTEYQELLSHATIFAYPSLYEGFGMQVLDALQRGIPVLTSQKGSLKEVAGDAAIFVDPESEASIASGLVTLLENPEMRTALAIKGPIQTSQFSWERTVDLFLESIEQLHKD